MSVGKDVNMGINWRAAQNRQQKTLERIEELLKTQAQATNTLYGLEMLKTLVEENRVLITQNEALIAHNEWVRAEAGYPPTQGDE